MGWLSPPDRRETTLILFCIIIYILAYNLESSLQLLGVDSVATSGALFSRVGLGKTRAIDRDGRKPKGWRDTLEDVIYGDWSWDEGHVAGNGDERVQKIGAGKHGAAWASKADIAGKVFGEVSVDEALQWWNDDPPQTEIKYHVPGYTVLDNLYIFNGSVYLVTDDTRDFPSVSSIISSTGPGFSKWALFSKRQASEQFGKFGGRIRGVSWIAADYTYHNSTLLALWRTHTSLNPTTSSTGQTILPPPPQRLLIPHTSFFIDINPPLHHDTIRRRRVDTGFHPYLLKAAFPQLTVMYFEDFEDYSKLEVPFVFERVVVADRKAAKRVLGDDEPSFITAFESRDKVNVEAEKGQDFWWDPIKRNLFEFLDLEMNDRERVVTYLVKQEEDKGGLKKEDHEKLVSALKRMERNVGCEVNIVYEDTKRTSWLERIEAIVRSTVILGVHGDHLMDFAFMKRSSYSTLIEMYPEGKFVRDRAVIANSVGQQYVAWSGTIKHTSEDLLQVALPRDDEEVVIDVDAVVQNVQQIISKL